MGYRQVCLYIRFIWDAPKKILPKLFPSTISCLRIQNVWSGDTRTPKSQMMRCATMHFCTSGAFGTLPLRARVSNETVVQSISGVYRIPNNVCKVSFVMYFRIFSRAGVMCLEAEPHVRIPRIDNKTSGAGFSVRGLGRRFDTAE